MGKFNAMIGAGLAHPPHRLGNHSVERRFLPDD